MRGGCDLHRAAPYQKFVEIDYKVNEGAESAGNPHSGPNLATASTATAPSRPMITGFSSSSDRPLSTASPQARATSSAAARTASGLPPPPSRQQRLRREASGSLARRGRRRRASGRSRRRRSPRPRSRRSPIASAGTTPSARASRRAAPRSPLDHLLDQHAGPGLGMPSSRSRAASIAPRRRAPARAPPRRSCAGGPAAPASARPAARARARRRRRRRRRPATRPRGTATPASASSRFAVVLVEMAIGPRCPAPAASAAAAIARRRRGRRGRREAPSHTQAGAEAGEPDHPVRPELSRRGVVDQVRQRRAHETAASVRAAPLRIPSRTAPHVRSASADSPSGWS